MSVRSGADAQPFGQADLRQLRWLVHLPRTLCGRNDMQIIGTGSVTYLLLSGISVHRNISVNENVELQPADTSHLDFNTAISTCSHPDDIAVVAAFIPRISAQFRITAPSSKELAIAAWNSSWDALLLSAIFHTEIGFNLQSDTPANEISSASHLCATNHHMHGLFNHQPYNLTEDDLTWVESNFSAAKNLLHDDRFQTSVHCLASYRWHTMPRIQLAVLWAGIEGMFGASSEIRFRISLCIARFLYPHAETERREAFETIKKLYDSRSAAVHGARGKGDMKSAVDRSADILCKLILQCIDNRATPRENELVP